MRTRTTILTGALLLASAAVAGAQDGAQTPPTDARLTATQTVAPAPTQVANARDDGVTGHPGGCRTEARHG